LHATYQKYDNNNEDNGVYYKEHSCAYTHCGEEAVEEIVNHVLQAVSPFGTPSRAAMFCVII
jgi:hypothetical protein